MSMRSISFDKHVTAEAVYNAVEYYEYRGKWCVFDTETDAKLYFETRAEAFNAVKGLEKLTIADDTYYPHRFHLFEAVEMLCEGSVVGYKDVDQGVMP